VSAPHPVDLWVAERQLRQVMRPKFIPELRRAIAESPLGQWWNAEIRTNGDAVETMAAGFCIVAACASIVAPLLKMAVRG